jgi:hypothetical protein
MMSIMNKHMLSSICALTFALIALSACSPDRDWQAALKRDTVDGYKNFLEQHHDSAYSSLAEQRMSALKEQQSWTTAQRLDSVTSYQAYLAAFPNGLYVKIATARIDTLNKGGDTQAQDIPAAVVPDHKPVIANNIDSTAKPSTPSVAEAASDGAAPAPGATAALTDASNEHPALTAKPAEKHTVALIDKPKEKMSESDKHKADLPVRAQVGVFSKHEGAETARNQAQTNTHVADVNFSIQELDRGDHKLWRVASNPLTREAAHNTCEALQKHSLDCAIIPR